MTGTLKALRTAAGLMLVLLLAAGIAVAQSATSGAIAGTVTDQTGAVVPNAKVTVTNNATAASSEITTDASGSFRATNLAPGNYTVTVSAANMANFKASMIVEVGLSTRLDAKLNVSAKGETVEVVDEAPVVNTEHPDLSTNFNQTAIHELPINGRRWSNYALLTPTGNPDGTFGLMSFRGISGLLNNNTIDGGDNNTNFWGEERGRTRLSYSISQDSVREFQVNTSNFSAEYGRSAGGAVNTVTKSGTNAYHGSGYWFIRDNALGATNPSTTLNGSPFKPDDRRQQFGGTIGGPVIKDKIFFFFNYDQQKRNFPGDAIPRPGFAPVTVTAAASCPASGSTTGLTQGQVIYCRFGQNVAAAQAASDAGFNFLNGLLGITPRTGDQLIFFPKVDVKLWGGNWATSYNWLNWTSPSGIQTQPTNFIAKDQFGSDIVRTRSLNSIYNKALSNTIAMEVRFHWSTELLAGGFGTDLPGQPSTPGPTGNHAPGVSISNWLDFGTQTYLPRPALPQEDQYQEGGNLVYSLGKHTLKVGGEWLHNNENIASLGTGYGSFSYSGSNAFADWLSDAFNTGNGSVAGSGVMRCGPTATPRPCYGGFTQGLGTLGYHYQTNDYAAYVQDDWKLFPRLNLNFGVRYEYEEFPNPQFLNSKLTQAANRPQDGNNWGPRGGFAWDILGGGKLVFRGGYGLYYGRTINSTIAGALTSTGNTSAQPFYSISASTLVGGAPLVYPNILTAATGLTITPSVVYFDSNFHNPMIHESDAILEYEVLKNTVASVSYLNSRGRGLINFLDTNLPAYQGVNTFTLPGGSTFDIPTYGTGARPDPNFSQITKINNTVDSDYNAVVFQVNRRMSRGLQFQSSYTYSKATDNGQNSTTFTTGNNALDPNNPGLEFGRSAFDVPHKFIFAGVWQPMFFKNDKNVAHYVLDDWTLAPIVNLSSGFTYSGTISGNLPSGSCASSHNAGINCSNPGFNSNRVASVERNSFRSDPRQTVDYRMSRRFAVTEKAKVEFIAEAFNLFNHPNVSAVNNLQYFTGTCGAATPGGARTCTLNQNATFGTPSTKDGGTNLRERQIQFAIRLEF